MGIVPPTTDAQATPPVPRRGRLVLNILVRSIVFSAAFAGLLFLPAGTWHFWQAWVFGAFYVLPIVALLFSLAVIDPQAAQRRLHGREREPVQRWITGVSIPLFLLALMVPGFDDRFGWTRTHVGAVPAGVSLAADCVALAGVLLIAWSIFVNRFAARTIRVEAGQQVISAGPYRLVRHPLYAGMSLAQLAMPVGLGSIVAVPLPVVLVGFYVVRLLNEEKVLARDLPGYSDYCLHTRWRLVPHLW